MKQFNSLKYGQDAEYYVDQGIKAERDAIASYEEAINSGDIPDDLFPCILRNYYDEVQHLEEFGSVKLACQAGLDYIYTS